MGTSIPEEKMEQLAAVLAGALGVESLILRVKNAKRVNGGIEVSLEVTDASGDVIIYDTEGVIIKDE